MRCDGFGSGCCTYYYENLCVEECSSDTHMVDIDFNCVDRKYTLITDGKMYICPLDMYTYASWWTP